MAACLAQAFIVMNNFSVVVILPQLQSELGLELADATWAINAYTLMFGGFVLLGGRAADLWDRKWVFVCGVSLFAAASLLCAAAPAPVVLLIARAVQGLGAALATPAGMALLTSEFPAGPARRAALATWIAVGAGAGSVGVLMGGLLAEVWPWQVVFLINAPFGAAVALLAACRLGANPGPARRRVDVRGAVVVTAGLLCLVYAVLEGRQVGWALPGTYVPGCVAVALLVCFPLLERRHPAPLVPLGLFRLKTLAAANAAMLALAGVPVVIIYLVTFYVQAVLRFDSLQTGLAFVPGTLAAALGSLASRRLMAVLGIRTVLLSSLTLVAVAVALLNRTGSGDYLTVILPSVTLMFFGTTCAAVSLQLLSVTEISRAEFGLGSGLIAATQQVGAALSLALLASLVVDAKVTEVGTDPAAELTRLHPAFWGVVVLAIVAFTLVAGILRTRSSDEA
ncbi:MFS transporter [Amycolatopsis deserti]|uniref:MFS transporter n=2 Tax=Amycolatopsis deserti TaxID=185696 RepID=A0ABQ3IZL5_9PSEU|nr:MFS transporter [Amycolatopsis deserti]